MTTLITNTHRERMLRLLDTGGGYEFLSLTEPYLEVVADDHYVRLMAVREYLKLGLVPPARELLEVQLPTNGLPPEFASLRESLAAVSTGAIPWTNLSERFEANLGALAGRGIDVASIREAWSDRSDDYQLFRDDRGVYQVRKRGSDGRWRWFPQLCDHRAADEARPLPPDIRTNMPGPYLFDGLGLGWYFRRIYEATRDTFLGYSCALFIVEPEAAAVAAVLHLHDWSDVLSDPRVFLFAGDGCMDRLRRAWDDDWDLPFPKEAFMPGGVRPGSSPGAVEVVRQAATQREAAIRESLRELEARYASRDRRYWGRRFEQALSGGGDRLRILAAVSTHTTFLQYSMRDAKRAFEALGHRCLILTEKTPYGIIGPLTYHQAIREFDPDLFFVIDHLRPEFEAILPANLPVLTWDQDQLPHVFTKHNMERIGELDFVAGWSKSRCIAAGCNPKQFLYARIPTSPEQFSGEPLTEEERKRYACDVSYVSHASQTPQAFHEQERTACTDQRLRKLLDAMYELTPPLLKKHTVMGGALASFILEEALRRCGLTIRDQELRNWLAGWYLWRLGDRIFRHEALAWVADWSGRTGQTFRIYGNGWDKHPTLSAFAAGPAENGRELLCIYRASRINLQLMPAGFIHQRALDGLAAGGFFLSRLAPNDLRGRAFRRLDARIRELGISHTAELLECQDECLRRYLRECFGEWLERIDPAKDDTVGYVRLIVELLHPDEVFTGFSDIVFASAAQFEEKAERFLEDEPARGAIVERMRRAVIEHFSYKPTMDRFLRAMTAYLRDSIASSITAEHL